MGVADHVFHVATEFEFEINEAVLKSETLAGAVGKISDAANSALWSVRAIPEFLATQFGAHVGLGAGLLGAITSSEKMQKNALALANILGNNQENLTGNVNTFNDRLMVSKQILKEIAETAAKFSLDEGPFIQMTKQIGAAMMNMAPQTLGKNLEGPREMARGLLKSAPILGVDPDLVQGELMRAIQGNASMGDTLFKRLALETKAMKPFMTGQGLNALTAAMTSIPGQTGYAASGVNLMMHHHTMNNGQVGAMAAQRFNMLPVAARFDILSKALLQFASDADVNAGNANLLANRFVMLKNAFIGVNGILAPIGEVLVPRINKVLDIFVRILEHARPFIQRFADKLADIIDHPDKIYVWLEQLRQLRHDVHLAGEVFSSAITIMWRKFIITTLITFGKKWGVFSAIGNVVKTFAPEFHASVAALMEFFKTASWGKIALETVTFAARAFWFVLARVLVPITLLVTMLQLFSRANAYAHIKDGVAVVNASGRIATRLADVAKMFYRIFRPLEIMFDMVAQAIAPFFSYSFYLEPTISALEMLGGLFEFLGTTTGYLMACLNGTISFFAKVAESFTSGFELLGHVIMSTISTIFTTIIDAMAKLNFGDVSGAMSIVSNGMSHLTDSWKIPTRPGTELGWGKAYDEGFEDFARKFLDLDARNAKGEKQNVTEGKTIINQVNVRQDFKENMEPDRIAHSLIKVLGDVAKNPTQSNGRSFTGAYFGRQTP